MKITTNSILVFFGLIGLMLVACLPVTMLTSPLFRPAQSTPDTFATLQVVVSQTMSAMTQQAPTQTSVSATATPLPPPVHASSYSDGCFVL